MGLIKRETDRSVYDLLLCQCVGVSGSILDRVKARRNHYRTGLGTCIHGRRLLNYAMHTLYSTHYCYFNFCLSCRVSGCVLSSHYIATSCQSVLLSGESVSHPSDTAPPIRLAAYRGQSRWSKLGISSPSRHQGGRCQGFLGVPR